MRIPLTHNKLIAPEHTLPADMPSRGVVRVVPEDLAEERPERSGAVAVSTLKPCNKCGSQRNDTRAGLCDKCMAKKKKPKAEAVSINEATLTVGRARELGAEVLAELGRAWDAWRARPSWDKRGQSDWYAAPEVKALLGIDPNDRVPQWVKRVKRRDLTEGKFSEEQAFDDETYESVGVFIRLPEWLADQWPKNGQDSSPTHVTMLYVGSCPQAKYDLVLEAVREVCKGIEPFTMDVSDYGEFVAGKPGVAPDAAMTIAHMVPRVMGGGKDLADLHEKLWAACEKRGVTADHFRDGPFKPHITLSYVKPGADQYDGPRPQGRFDVRYLDLWGEDPDSDYGYKRIPLGSAAKGGPDKPKAELVTEARRKILDKVKMRGKTIKAVQVGEFVKFTGSPTGDHQVMLGQRTDWRSHWDGYKAAAWERLRQKVPRLNVRTAWDAVETGTDNEKAVKNDPVLLKVAIKTILKTQDEHALDSWLTHGMDTYHHYHDDFEDILESEGRGRRKGRIFRAISELIDRADTRDLSVYVAVTNGWGQT